MEWLSTLAAGASSAGPLGLLAGLLGGALQQWQKRSIAKIEAQDRENSRAHEIALLKATSDNMIAETAANIKVTQVEGDIATDLARYQVDGKILDLAMTDVAKTDELIFSPAELKGPGFGPRFARFVSIWVRFSLASIEAARRLFRPLASYYSLIGLTFLTLWVTDMLVTRQLALTDKEALTLWWRIIETDIFLATTCVTWWFISRENTHDFKGH
jgi:hypothetical protein